MGDFKAIGISYHHAPLELREEVALNSDESKEFLIKLKETLGLEEGLIVSTCNRTEVYYTSESEVGEQIISLLAVQKSIKKEALETQFKSYSPQESIAHLFDVALGLDSKVLGDIQIANQVKRSYQLSADLDMAGPYLHRLMHTIFFANKRVVQETRLQDGNASVAAVSVDVTKRFIENIANPKIVVIGTGEIGENVVENLKSVNASITLINRTKSKAEALAQQFDLEFARYEDREEIIKQSDVIISSVPTSGSLMSNALISQKLLFHKLFLDLSVPRSIPEEVGKLEGVTLYNVDLLTERTEKARKIREKSVPAVKEIIEESIDGFEDWKNEMEVSPTIQKLKQTLDDIRRTELARHSSKVSSEEMELLEVVTKNMIQKVIKLPILQLKAACKRGESDALVGLINDLFNLEQTPVKDE